MCPAYRGSIRMIDIPRVNSGLSYVQFTEPVPILGVFGIAIPTTAESEQIC